MVTTAAVAQAITVIFYRAETGMEEGSKDIASMAKLLKKIFPRIPTQWISIYILFAIT